MEYLPFGRTGHVSSRAIFGAFALGRVSQGEADRLMETAIAHGINHIDVAATYDDAELRLGPWMERERGRFFLATKTWEREAGAAGDDIRRSLERMRTDHVDLIQLHNLADPAEWEVAMGPGGALEACLAAREEGLVRFIGVTGHGLGVAAMHLRSLEAFDFDSVLFPFSYILMKDPGYAADVRRLMTTCRERRIAMQTIKAVTKGPWRVRTPEQPTWYEPLTRQEDIDAATHWVLAEPDVFLNTVGDPALVPLAFDAVERFEARPNDERMEQLLARADMRPLFTA